VPALIRALDDEEALVRGHVAWALGRIGLRDGIQALETRLRVESDPTVRMEIDEAIREAAELPETKAKAQNLER
jgi:epoxyqueuosine reductase